MQVAALNAVLTANVSQFVSSMAAATAATKASSRSIKSVGATLTRNLSVPMALVGAASIKMAMDYESSLFRMQGLAGLTANEMNEMDEAIRQISSDTATGPRELAEAMYFIASSGIQGAAAVDVLRASAMGAVAGLGDVQTVADAATSAINAYGQENLTGAQAVNALTGAVRLGKAEADEIANAIGRVIPIASEMGISFTDVAAAIAAMTRVGLSGAVSVTALRAVLSTVANPTVKARETLAQYGTSIEEVRSTIEDEGLLPAMLDLSAAVGGNDEAITSIFGNVRALVGALALMGENAGTAREVFAEMQSDTNFLGEAFDAVSQTSAFQMKQALADLEVAAVDLGTALMPLVTAVAGFVGAIATGFSSLPGPVRTAISAFVAVGAALGPVIWLVGNFVDVIKNVGPAMMRAAAAMARATMAWAAANPVLAAVVVSIAAVVAAFMAFQQIASGGWTEGPDIIARISEQAAESMLASARMTGDAVTGIQAALAQSIDAEFATALDEAGVSLSELTDLLMGSEHAWDEWVASMDGSPLEQFGVALEGLRRGAMSAADDFGALQHFGAIPPVDPAVAAGMGDLADETNEARTGAEGLAAAWANMNNTLTTAGAMIAAEQGVRDLAAAIATAGEEGGITRDEMLDLDASMVDLVGTLQAQAEALATSADGTVDIAGAQEVLRGSLEAVGATLTGPMKVAWDSYTRDIMEAPDHKTTNVTAPGLTPRTHEFWVLDDAVRAPPSSIAINVSSNVGSVLAQWQALPAAIKYAADTANSVNIPASIAAPGRSAVGGPIGRGQTKLVGEHGPEIFTPSAAGVITSNGTSRMGTHGAIAPGGRGGNNPNVIVAQIDERSLAKAIAREMSQTVQPVVAV